MINYPPQLKKSAMKKIFGKIILVDNEKYEKELITLALYRKEWDVDVDYYKNAEEAIDHLKKYKQEEIFLIISDMNMLGMSGLDFKKKLDADKDLNAKAIPFVFVSTFATKEDVARAYNYRVQGYFSKPISIEDQAEMLDIIIRYWVISRHPHKAESQEITSRPSSYP
jgi:CheY-like chemotaxis protein